MTEEYFDLRGFPGYIRFNLMAAQKIHQRRRARK